MSSPPELNLPIVPYTGTPTRKLKVKWKVEQVQDLNAYHFWQCDEWYEEEQLEIIFKSENN